MEDTALIDNVRLTEHKYGSVVKAPKPIIQNLQKIANKLPNPKADHPSMFVRLDTRHVPVITTDYRVYKGWQRLCFGDSSNRICDDYKLSNYRLSGLRKREYVYQIFVHGRMHTYKGKTLDRLLYRLKRRHIDAPRSRYGFQYAMHRYSQGQKSKYPGNCYKVYIMRKLILRTGLGDIHAKIPLSLRA